MASAAESAIKSISPESPVSLARVATVRNFAAFETELIRIDEKLCGFAAKLSGDYSQKEKGRSSLAGMLMKTETWGGLINATAQLLPFPTSSLNTSGGNCVYAVDQYPATPAARGDNQFAIAQSNSYNTPGELRAIVHSGGPKMTHFVCRGFTCFLCVFVIVSLNQGGGDYLRRSVRQRWFVGDDTVRRRWLRSVRHDFRWRHQRD